MGRLPCVGVLLRPKKPRQVAKKSRGGRPVFLLSHLPSKVRNENLARLLPSLYSLASTNQPASMVKWSWVRSSISTRRGGHHVRTTQSRSAVVPLSPPDAVGSPQSAPRHPRA